MITFGIAKSGRLISDKQEDTVFSGRKETLYLWYADEGLTSYLSAAAVTYNESHDVRVVPVLESGLEYLEKINSASLAEDGGADIYVLSHDLLGKAYLAGLASEVSPPEGVLMEESYMGTGLNAAAYKDKIIGYPFYFETSALLYNKTYLKDMAVSFLETEKARAEAENPEGAQGQGAEGEETAPADGSAQAGENTGTGSEAGSGEDAGDGRAEDEMAANGFSKEQIAEKMQELLPATIEEIETFADNYDAPEQVEGVFKWDVTDIFYNYFFVGNSIKIGGEAGWDTSQIDIYNQDAIASMRVYQDLNQVFSIDTGEIDYDTILDEFIDGKMVFTIATTDAVARLEQAREEGLFAYEYDVALAPDVSESKKGRSLSMTNCVVVNGYSENKEEANDFAYFLTSQYNDILYARAGKVSAAKEMSYDYETLGCFAKEYERSISMPKMIETSGFWLRLEQLFSKVWNGADANEMLKQLSEQVMSQVTGSPYEEQYIEEEIPKEEDEEYLDEEYYTQEALDEQ